MLLNAHHHPIRQQLAHFVCNHEYMYRYYSIINNYHNTI